MAKNEKKKLNKTPAESGSRLRLHRSLLVSFIVENMVMEPRNPKVTTKKTE